MTERELQSAFTRFVKDNRPNASAVFELKLAKGPSLAFNSLAPHQVSALLDAKTEQGVYYRIMDQPWMPDRKYSFQKPKPFDCFFVREVEAYVVVCFYKPRKRKEALFIHIDAWCKEVKDSKRKSLTEARAREISSKAELI